MRADDYQKSIQDMTEQDKSGQEIILSGTKAIARRLDGLASRTLSELSTRASATKLFDAVRADDLSSVRQLLNDTPSLVHERFCPWDYEGTCVTPLHAATFNLNTEIMKELLARGADVDAQTEDCSPCTHYEEAGYTALHWAAHCSYIDRRYGPPIDPKKVRVRLGDPFRDRVNAIQTLLLFGADVHAVDSRGCAPLHHAAWGLVDVIKVLITHGADVECRDDEGETPLHRASFFASIECVDALIASGADCNALCGAGANPLIDAIPTWTDCDEPVIRALLEAGADPNCTTVGGNSPLRNVVGSYASNKLACARVLVEYGAILSGATHVSGVTLLHDLANGWLGKAKACSMDTYNDWEEIVESLRETPRTQLYEFQEMQIEAPWDLDIAWWLIMNGVPMSSRDKDGCTPRDIASQCMHPFQAIVLHVQSIALDVVNILASDPAVGEDVRKRQAIDGFAEFAGSITPRVIQEFGKDERMESSTMSLLDKYSSERQQIIDLMAKAIWERVVA